MIPDRFCSRKISSKRNSDVFEEFCANAASRAVLSNLDFGSNVVLRQVHTSWF